MVGNKIVKTGIGRIRVVFLFRKKWKISRVFSITIKAMTKRVNSRAMLIGL